MNRDEEGEERKAKGDGGREGGHAKGDRHQEKRRLLMM